jgi:hypothetical protein
MRAGCAVGVCSSPQHCQELGHCFSRTAGGGDEGMRAGISMLADGSANLATLEPCVLSICGTGGELLVKIHLDGRLEYGETYTPDVAARTFWNALAWLTPAPVQVLTDRVAELEREVDVDNKLLAERDRLLEAIPACDAHGDKCIPAAIEWVGAARIDAEKWRTLIGCGRIYPLGSAGLDKDDANDPDYGHVGIDLWTKHPPFEHLEPQRAIALKWLDKFIEKAQRVKAALKS